MKTFKETIIGEAINLRKSYVRKTDRSQTVEVKDFNSEWVWVYDYKYKKEVKIKKGAFHSQYEEIDDVKESVPLGLLKKSVKKHGSTLVLSGTKWYVANQESIDEIDDGVMFVTDEDGKEYEIKVSSITKLG